MVNVFPMMSDSYRVAEERFAAWQTAAVRVILASSLLFAACCLALAEPILGFLYGEEFESAATVMQILGLNVVFFSLISVFMAVARFAGTTGRQPPVADALSGAAAGLRGGVGRPAGRARGGDLERASSLAHVALLVRATARAGAPSKVVALAWRFALAPRRQQRGDVAGERSAAACRSARSRLRRVPRARSCAARGHSRRSGAHPGTGRGAARPRKQPA